MKNGRLSQETSHRILPSHGTGNEEPVSRRGARHSCTVNKSGHVLSPQAIEVYGLTRKEYIARLRIETAAHPFYDGVPVRTFTQCQADHAARMEALTQYYEHNPAFRASGKSRRKRSSSGPPQHDVPAS